MIKTILAISFTVFTATGCVAQDAGPGDYSLAANKAARKASHERFVRNGGCDGDFLTTEQATFCWARARQANAFPPLGASEGGSDGGESGGDGK